MLEPTLVTTSILGASMPEWALGVVIGITLLVGVVVWRRSFGGMERRLAKEIGEGRYVRALEYFVEQGRFADAAAIEEARGNHERAAEFYERAGALAQAGEMYRAVNNHGLAALAFRDAGRLEDAAEAFLANGKTDVAAPLFTQAGAHGRAAECWLSLERRSEAAEAFAAAGEVLRAAAIHLEEGEMRRAGELFRDGSDYLRAASAFWKAGDIAASAACLGLERDWVKLGRLWAMIGDDRRAIEALALAEKGDERFRSAWILKAQLEERIGDSKAALVSYATLLDHDIARETHDESTRRWILAMAQHHLRDGDTTSALGALDQLERLGLMTPTLATKVASLRNAVVEKRAKESRALIDSLQLPTNERYHFIEQIGRGGNGVIYKVHDQTLDRIVAMKLIHGTALSNERALEWFLREAKTAARLNHQNIVTIYDLGVLDSQPYIAMEYVEGETLVGTIERTGRLPLSLDELRPLVEGLVSALQYAHDEGVVHLDIKLENVMISSRGDVKLMDFGLARAISGAREEKVVTGTPLYMAPEQIAGGAVDHRTDIYAFGVMLYLLCVGKWPVGRDTALHDHLYESPPDPRSRNPKLSEEAAQVILKCLSKSRRGRHDRIEDVGANLLAAMQPTPEA